VLIVVRDGKSAVLHPEVGSAQGGWVEVKGTDLKEGELVVVEGGYNLPKDTPVKLASAKDEKDEGKGEAKEGDAKKDEPEPKGKAEPKAEAGK